MNRTQPLPGLLSLALLCSADLGHPGFAMNDPTRPALPSAHPAPQSGVTAARSLAPAASPVAAAPVEEPHLQSLQLPREGAPSALVNGQLLRVGDKMGLHTVTSIDERGVSVNGPAGRQRWTLLGVDELDPAPARRVAARPIAETTLNREASSPTLLVAPRPVPKLPEPTGSGMRPASLTAAGALGTTPRASSWADLIAPAEPTSVSVAPRVRDASDLARWNPVKALPELNGARRPSAQGRFVLTHMAQPTVPASILAALEGRRWRAATPAGRAILAAAEPALTARALELATGATTAAILPAEWANDAVAALGQLPPAARAGKPSPPAQMDRPAPHSVTPVRLRMSLEPEPKPSRPNRLADWIKESS